MYFKAEKAILAGHSYEAEGLKLTTKAVITCSIYTQVSRKRQSNFRLFQFSEENGINGEQLKAYIQLCLAMSQFAKDLKNASPKLQQPE